MHINKLVFGWTRLFSPTKRDTFIIINITVENLIMGIIVALSFEERVGVSQ